MKSLLLTLAGMLVFALATPASAQTSSKEYNDATVHPHNYKHPNKAALRPARGLEFREKYRKAQTVADFKEKQRRGGQLDATIAIPARDVAASESRNYKQPQPVTKPRRKADKADSQPVIEPTVQDEIGN